MFVNYFASYGTAYTDRQALGLAFGTAGIQVFNSIAKATYLHHMMQCSMSMRLSLVANIYRKARRDD